MLELGKKRVQNLNLGFVKIARIARNDDQIGRQGRGGDHGIEQRHCGSPPAYLIYRLRGLALGHSLELTDLDMLLFLPLHSVYSFRAKRRYEKELQRRELRQLFRPVTIAPAVIVPPHLQVQPTRLDRAKVAIRRMRGANTR